MKREIERKFLVKKGKLLHLPQGKTLVTGYFCENPEIRVRIEGNRGFLTIKTQGLISRNEFEYEICLREAKKILNLSCAKIEKNRSTLKIDGITWQIDLYKGLNRGLAIAEAELPNTSYELKKPLWVKTEVTEELRFRNYNLAKRPFSKWPKE
jgi:CYTH domain-containing protein